jgi:hypothetical protein
MGRNHRVRAGPVTVGDAVYLPGVGHTVDNRGTVSRFWANGWIEVHFPGWIWVGEAADLERCQRTD